MRLAVLVLISGFAVFGAEEAHDSGNVQLNKWIHFGLLAAGIAVLWTKFATPGIRARGEAIRKDLEEARKLKADSNTRVAQIESRLGNLSGEIEAFRVESRQMIETETAKISKETEQLLARVQTQAESEIASLTKAARAEVKAEAARLALQLAEQKIAQGLSPETHGALLSEFVSDLKEVGHN